MEIFIFVIGILRIVQASCNKKTSDLMKSKDIFFRYGMLFEFSSAVFGFVYLGISGFSGFNVLTVIVSVVTAISYVTEFLTALEAMKRAPLVLCNMCSLGGGIVLASVNGIFLFGEKMTLVRWLGVALFFVVPVCIADDAKKQKEAKRFTAGTVGILAVNFLLNGMATTMSKVFGFYVKGGNAAMYTVVTYFCAFLLFLILFVANRVQAERQNTVSKEKVGALFPKKLWMYAVILGATCSSIVYITTRLSRTIDLSVLNTVPSAVSIIGCLLVGALLYGEKITARKCIGVVCGILSAVMVIYG